MKVLLVEDDEFFHKFYAFKLQEQGFEVAIAKNGLEGIAKLKEFLPDLVLLDLIMPIKDGFDFLQEKRVLENVKNIPVIVFSTLGQEQDMQKAKSLGANDYINKSFFDFDNLLRKIFTFMPKPT